MIVSELKNERLAILSKVKWTEEEIKTIENEEGFKVLEYKSEGKNEDGKYKYAALVKWN